MVAVVGVVTVVVHYMVVGASAITASILRPLPFAACPALAAASPLIVVVACPCLCHGGGMPLVRGCGKQQENNPHLSRYWSTGIPLHALVFAPVRSCVIFVLGRWSTCGGVGVRHYWYPCGTVSPALAAHS